MLRINVKQDGAYVIYEFYDGTKQFYVQMEAQNARELAQQSDAVIKLAEEYVARDQIIRDSAILMRSGAPIALTDNPAFVDAAKQQAAWDSELRRYMPMKGITSQEKFGTPTILQTSPKVKQ